MTTHGYERTNESESLGSDWDDRSLRGDGRVAYLMRDCL